MVVTQNPTHSETLSEGRRVLSERAENQFEGITRKKSRKNNGLGVFSKLLAGLSSKKTLMQGEGSLKGLHLPETAESGIKKDAFSHFKDAKSVRGSKNSGEIPKVRVSLSGESKVKPAENPDRKHPPGVEFLLFHPEENLVQPLVSRGEAEKNQTFSFEQVSLKTDFSKEVKEIPYLRVPFKRGDPAENSLLGEIRNAALHSKNEGKVLKTDDLSEKNVTDAKKFGKKRVSVDVHDLRTQTGGEAGTIAERGLKGAEEIRSSPVKEITVELRQFEERSEKPAAEGQKTPAGESFEQLLARELRGDLSADIVRQASIVLRDGGEGTIRLSLKPETLGKVKIHLEMAENRISGHIFVESEEALRAFKQEIQSLEQSFRDSGFEASLNAALDYRNGEQHRNEIDVEPYYSEQYAASYENSSEITSYFGFEVSVINVLV